MIRRNVSARSQALQCMRSVWTEALARANQPSELPSFAQQNQQQSSSSPQISNSNSHSRRNSGVGSKRGKHWRNAHAAERGAGTIWTLFELVCNKVKDWTTLGLTSTSTTMPAPTSFGNGAVRHNRALVTVVLAAMGVSLLLWVGGAVWLATTGSSDKLSQGLGSDLTQRDTPIDVVASRLQRIEVAQDATDRRIGELLNEFRRERAARAVLMRPARAERDGRNNDKRHQDENEEASNRLQLTSDSDGRSSRSRSGNGGHADSTDSTDSNDSNDNNDWVSADIDWREERPDLYARSVGKADDPSDKKRVEILLWEGSPNWAHFGWKRLDGQQRDWLRLPNYLGHEVVKECDIECVFHGNKSRIPVVDAVLLEGTAYGRDALTELVTNHKLRLPQKRPYQSFINFGYEHIKYFPLPNHSSWKDSIDIEATFSQKGPKATTPVSFTCNWGGLGWNGSPENSTDIFLAPPPPASNRERAPVIFMSSNCGAGGAERRTKFVEEMMKYVSIDSYGKCLHNREMPPDQQFSIYNDHGKSMLNKINMFKKYKFVLAFENNEVEDYVSEKIVNVYQAGSVPIYMGAPNIDEWTPGDKTMIKTSDFSSARALAEEIVRLDQDDDAYMEYFAWKKKGLSERFLDKYRKCVFYQTECRLCHDALRRQKAWLTRRRAAAINDINPLVPRVNFALALARSGFIEVSPSPVFDSLEREYSISAWIRPETFSDFRIVDRNVPSTLLGFNFDVFFSVSAAFLRLCAGSACRVGKTPLIPNHWYHVMATFSSSRDEIRLYLDGVLDATYTGAFDAPTKVIPDMPLRIGGAVNGSSTWDGLIDDVALWSRALRHDEIHSLRFRELQCWFGSEDVELGLVAYYAFNEGRGRVVHDACGPDSSLSRGRTDGSIRGIATFAAAETKEVHVARFGGTVIAR